MSARVSIGSGCCSASKKQKRISNLASSVIVLAEILVLAALLVLSGDVVKMENWLHIIMITIICVHVPIQLWELKVFLWPNQGEKFSLTIQGSHERKRSRHRKTMYGVTVSEEVKVDYDRNSEGTLVYFRKVTSSSNTKAFCQPFLLPLKGWFTFFHVLIALALLICDIIIFVNCNDCRNDLDSWESTYYNCGTNQVLLPIFLLLSVVLQVTVVMSSYYRAEDCGFCIPLFWVCYTRWFKHTNAYTEMIQQNIQAKHGQRLQQEGEQLEIAIRKNMQRTEVNGVSYRNVGPQTAKRYEDQVVLLHLLLAQEHDQVCKLVFPEYNIENKGVSFTLTADEINSLNMHAEQILETPKDVVTDDSPTVVTVDATELVSRDEENTC